MNVAINWKEPTLHNFRQNVRGVAGGAGLCTAQIPRALAVAERMIVSCQAELGDGKIDIYVLVDPGSMTKECHELNNAALYQGVACGAVPQ